MPTEEILISTLGGQIIVGLASGLLSSLIVFLSATFVNDSIVPWFQRRFYRGLSVSGIWRGDRKDGDRNYGFAIEIRQSGYALSGTFNAVNTNADGTQTNKLYGVVGTIVNNCVFLNYEPMSSRIYGGGSFVFQIYSAGRELRGGMLYMRTKSSEIKAVDDLVLTRRDD